MNHSATSKDEPTIVSELNKGSKQAFDCLFDIYHAKLFLYCFRFVKSKDLADEIVQETFIKIWNSREGIDPGLSFGSFLFKIAFNGILDFHRKVARDAAMQQEMVYRIEQSHNHTEDEIIYKDLQRLSDEAIQLMPDQQRLVFKLSRERGLSHEEIATQLGISSNTVKVHIFKSLKHIRSYLQQNADFSFVLIITFLSQKR
ncbi:RNA polymerase sigma factor [Ohtaekwangia koreensis]|uniref:RNA polymerase sigma factor n=1 Tax=Ohtaekwangia koreensis TaxID=688867 RepID=A0A1T5M4S9_9BACT|nr:RNA polymerase sigma-70 factor [Ohtaekwangia koreensis]SKC83251.1 RNA polymerase sigma-70 factor, ECF subfamily [Ohtaekwangia koreensis]